eukprot:s4545_g1.t1
MVPSRNRTLESVVYAGSGGANPFHPDFTEHRLHDFRELANASAPVGLQLLSIPADGNCMFASIKAALSNGLNRSPDAVMVFRQQCVDHLEQYTDLDPDHLQKLRLSGEWGDGYILQAAATLTRSRVQVWSPIWESCFRVVSEADLWDQDIFLAYNGTHYDAYVRKRRIRRKSPSYLYYGLADKLDVHAPTLSEAINADESVPAAPPNDLSLEDSNLNLENPLSGQAAVGAWESLPGDEEYGSWASHALHCGHLALPAKSALATDEQEQSEIPSPFELTVLEGGYAYPLPVPERRSFTTTGNTALLQTANGSFAEHLCKFWALVRWHEGYVARQGSFTSWLELMLAFEMSTGRPVPFQKSSGSEYVWPEDGRLQEVPANNRVATFRAGYNHLSKVFQKELCPAGAQVPVSFYGCNVQRQPIPGFAVRAEYPYRQEVCFFLQSTLLSLRSKTTFMHQVLQPPRAADAWDLSYPAPSAGLEASYKPQWGWVQANDGSRTWRRLPPGHDAMVSFRLASEFGRYEPVQLFDATKAQRALFEMLWREGTVTKGIALCPVMTLSSEGHGGNLARFINQLRVDFISFHRSSAGGQYWPHSPNDDDDDVPNGLAAISKVPAAGWGQILAYMAFCEVSQDQSPGTPAAAGDFGFKVLTSSDPAEKTKKLSAELANSRLAMMAIIGMFF